ncbi:hypothetical protein BDA96_01G140200 [Sorghum bicolor]|uniref:Uncharacterized protein n=1 Tax=Sorghum bicolor TaxID=4558 RepID=A0A921RYS8_SORBI|nr:hypothetical protein BDA96_01G140200 [Sorghum bicolor]
MSLCINPSLFSSDSDSPYYVCLVSSCHLEHQLLVSELNLYSSLPPTVLLEQCSFPRTTIETIMCCFQLGSHMFTSTNRDQ